jgi:hypothetical protein
MISKGAEEDPRQPRRLDERSPYWQEGQKVRHLQPAEKLHQGLRQDLSQEGCQGRCRQGSPQTHLLSKWRTRATVNVKITFTFSTREVHTRVSRFRMRTLLGP